MATIYNRGSKKQPNYTIVYDDFDENGSRQRKFISVRKYLGLKRRATHEEAKELLREIEDQLSKNEFVEPNYQTGDEFFPEWLKAQEVDVSPSTYDKYTNYINKHILPFFGTMKVREITPNHILQFKARLLKSKSDGGKGLKPETAKSILNTLSTALDQSGLPRNPCKHKVKKKNVSSVKVPKEAVRTLNEKEVKEMRLGIKGLGNLRNYVLVSEAVSTGLRSGELCGLLWKDVDLKRKTITVTGSMKRKGSSFYRAPYAKSDRSLRTIDITNKDTALLKELKKSQAAAELESSPEKPKFIDQGYVFANHDGSPLNPMWVTHLWGRIRTKLKLPQKLTFHDLRHTCATLWIKNGIPVNVVSQRLGHKEETITWRYGHVQAGMQREAAERMSKILD